jgi:hypothetical protein
VQVERTQMEASVERLELREHVAPVAHSLVLVQRDHWARPEPMAWLASLGILEHRPISAEAMETQHSQAKVPADLSSCALKVAHLEPVAPSTRAR